MWSWCADLRNFESLHAWARHSFQWGFRCFVDSIWERRRAFTFILNTKHCIAGTSAFWLFTYWLSTPRNRPTYCSLCILYPLIYFTSFLPCRACLITIRVSVDEARDVVFFHILYKALVFPCSLTNCRHRQFRLSCEFVRAVELVSRKRLCQSLCMKTLLSQVGF